MQRLADDAGLPLTVTHWPLPRYAVQAALAALPTALPEPLAAARARVEHALDDDAGARLSATLRTRDEALAGFGDDGTAGPSLALQSAVHESPAVAWRMGLRVEDDAAAGRRGARVRLDGSVVAVEAAGWQLQAGALRYWWGPGWQSSLVLGNNAPPLAGIGLQRASAGPSDTPWLAWMGPWQFSFVVGRLDGHDTPGDPYLIAHRLTLRPWPSLEIGLTRTMQWGGRGRDESPRGFLRALAGSGSNAGDTTGGADPSNSLAGIDLRWRCPAGAPCAAYTQWMGEDEAGHLPSKWLAMYGLEGWTPDGRHRGFVEFAETGCRAPIGHAPQWGCAYRNHAYPGGYTHGGRWLGAAVGPDARLLTIGWQDLEAGHQLRLHAGRAGARIGRFGPAGPGERGELVGLSAQTRWRSGGATWTPTFDWTRVDAAEGHRTDARIGLRVEWPLSGW